MNVQLIYRDQELGEAWGRHFADSSGIEVIAGDITTTKCDAIVSPANSFGFMDGGLDLALSNRFGWHLQDHVRTLIEELPEKELLIGKALVIETGDKNIRWIIIAPTMRVPMSFGIGSSVNAYLAMKAVLIAARSHSMIRSLAIPGLCTGVGRMPPEISARQMFMAYDEVVLGNRQQLADFDEAQRHHLKLNPTALIWDH